MMKSYLVVAHQPGLVEELHRQVGEDFQVFPLKSVSHLSDSSDERVAAVVIRVPAELDTQRAGIYRSAPQDQAAVRAAAITLEARVDELEKRVIEDCLFRNGHRRKETADELGISRVTLYNKMKKFGLL